LIDCAHALRCQRTIRTMPHCMCGLRAVFAGLLCCCVWFRLCVWFVCLRVCIHVRAPLMRCRQLSHGFTLRPHHRLHSCVEGAGAGNSHFTTELTTSLVQHMSGIKPLADAYAASRDHAVRDVASARRNRGVRVFCFAFVRALG
jgi:hypothetical protein